MQQWKAPFKISDHCFSGSSVPVCSEEPTVTTLKPTFIVLGSEAGFDFKEASETKSLETGTGKLMYNFCKKVKDLISSEDWS